METKCLLPSLKNISLCKLAQDLYYNQMNEALLRDTSCFPTLNEISMDACDYIEHKLNLPLCLVPLLQQHVQFIEEELSWWLSNILQIIDPNCSTQTCNRVELSWWLSNIFHFIDLHYPKLKCNPDVIEYCSCIVWDTDGYINYEKTVLNLLASKKLNRSQKYALTCIYCMEDELKKFWSEDSCDDLEDRIINGSHLMLYWNRFKKKGVEKFLPHSLSRNIDMLKFLYSWEFVAVEYFWNRLSFENQFDHVELCSYPRVLAAWLEKLNENHLREIINEKLREILIIFTNFRSYPKYIYWLWTLIKDIISEDVFIKFLVFIKRMVTKSVESMNLSTTLLIDIWTSSSPKLKRHAFQYQNGSCIYNLCNVMQCDKNRMMERDDRIISIILSDASSEFREAFWQDECVKYLVIDTIRFNSSIRSLE